MSLPIGYLVSVEIKRNGDRWMVVASYNSDRETRKRAHEALSYNWALFAAGRLPLTIEMEPQ